MKKKQHRYETGSKDKKWVGPKIKQKSRCKWEKYVLPETAEKPGEETVSHHLQTKALKGQKAKVYLTCPANHTQ